jgi:hypothetical protein
MDLKLILCMYAHFYGTPLNGHAIIYIDVTCKLIQDWTKKSFENLASMCSFFLKGKAK